MRYIKKILLLCALVMIMSGTSTVFADTDCQGASYSGGFVPLSCATQSPMLEKAYNSKDLGAYVNTLFTIALSVGAILAVMRIAYAGYLYMGNDMWGKKQQAREILGDVTLGLLLLLSITLILKQINPNLLKLDVLNPANLKQAETPPAGTGSGNISVKTCADGSCTGGI